MTAQAAPGRPLRVGVLGVGAHGRRYAAHIASDVPGLVLAGIFRRDRAARESLAAELGVPSFESAEALLDAADAVAIVTPPPSHRELVLAALERGKPVLVEKPLTTTRREAEALLAASERVGGRVMVAHTLRYDSVIRGVRERLHELAPVRYLRMSQRLNPTALAWQRNRELSGGGSILLTGVHLFDGAAWILGEPIVLDRCVAERVLNPAVEDFFHAMGRTPSGIHVSLEVSKYTTHRSCFVEVVGEGGQLLGDYQQHALTIGCGPNERVPIDVRAVPTVPLALADFAAYVRAERPNPIPLRDGLAAVALAEEAYRLARLSR
jgi:predicted dehydrogenase